MSSTGPTTHRADEVPAFEVVIIGPLPEQAADPYWLVRWRQPNKSFQEFRCTTEGQAQRFAKLWEVDGRVEAEGSAVSEAVSHAAIGR